MLGGLLCVTALAMADGFLRGPVTGLVHNAAAGTIHRIDGMPGAATVSEAIATGVEARVAVFDRAQRFAILAAGTGEVYLVRDPAGPEPRTERLAGAMENVNRIELSADGTAAALYSVERHSVQLMGGLPDAVKFSTAVEAGSDVTAMAVSASGALLASGRDGHATIFRLTLEGDMMPVAEAGSVRSLTFWGREGLAYADLSRNQLVRVRGLAPGAETAVLAGAADGVDQPRGVCALPDGGLVLVNAATAMLFDAEGRRTGSIALEFEPKGCGMPGSGPELLLNEAGRGPLFLLDYSDVPRVMFVPAAAASEKAR